MNRYIKALGLGLFAAFAMSAMAASSASATVYHTFHADGPTAYLTAEADPNGGGKQVFFGSAADGTREFYCNEINVNGEIKGTKTTETDYSATSVTVEPIYNDCHARFKEITVNAKVTINGCHYTFTHQTTEGGSTPGIHAPVDITCPEGKEITIDVSALNTPCVHIPGGQTLHGVRYKNGETGGIKDVTLEATVSGIKSTTTNKTVCPTASGKETEIHEDGTYTGNTTVTGFKDAAHTERTSIWTTESETNTGT